MLDLLKRRFYTSQNSEPDNLVLDDNVFFPQEVEPDLQLLVPPIRPNMAEERILLSDPFLGSSKEDAAEFWRRLETYLEYKRSDDSDKLRLTTAMFVCTARDWYEGLAEERKDTFPHLKAAFAEKFIQPAILKWQSANDIFTKKQMQTETVDDCANRIKNLGKRIEFNDSTLMFALFNGLKSAIKGQVLARNPQSFAEAVDYARLAELSVFVTTSSTENMITEQVAQMRCDIQQLAGKGMVNDTSITTLTTDRVNRSPSPSPRRVHFNEPEATRPTRPQYVPQRPLRSAAAGGNRVFTPFRSDRREIVNGRFNGQNNRQRPRRQTSGSNPVCPKCGNNQHENAMRCPAIGKQCWNCSRFGHLRNVCRAGGRNRE